MSELSEALRSAVNYELLGLHTALPGRVESYDATKQQARVQPLVKRVYADGKVESLPKLPAVPVVFPRTAAGSLTFKVAKGDGVLLIFAERAIERFLAKGGEQEPGKPRHHDLSDAIAIPGLYPFVDPSPGAAGADALLATTAGAALKLDAGKIALGTPSAEVLDLLSQFMDLVATSNCVPAAPLTNAAMIAALKIQLETIKGVLP